MLHNKKIIIILCFLAILSTLQPIFIPYIDTLQYQAKAQSTTFGSTENDQGGQGTFEPPGQQIQTANVRFLKYNDLNFGYTIAYPVGSEIQPGERGVIIIKMPQGIATIGVVDNSKHRDMDKYTSELLRNLGKTFDSFKILNRGVDSLGGNPSRFITFSFIDDNGDQRLGSYSWTLIGDRAYELGFSSSPQESATISPIVKTMTASFHVPEIEEFRP